MVAVAQTDREMATPVHNPAKANAPERNKLSMATDNSVAVMNIQNINSLHPLSIIFSFFLSFVKDTGNQCGKKQRKSAVSQAKNGYDPSLLVFTKEHCRKPEEHGYGHQYQYQGKAKLIRQNLLLYYILHDSLLSWGHKIIIAQTMQG